MNPPNDDRTEHEPVRDAPEVQRFFGVAPPAGQPPRQLSLDGMAVGGSFHLPVPPPGRSQADVYNLLFAIYPEPEDAARIGAEGLRLVGIHRLRNRPQPRERLHVTLCSLGLFAAVPNAFIDAAKAAANGIACPSLPLVFDTARSFQAGGAFALYGDSATEAAVARLRRPLMAALRRHGLVPTESPTPHMSLVYNCGAVLRANDVAPLAWTARRFALVISHVGLTHHEPLGEWALPRAH